MELKARQKAILAAAVERYVLTAEPVGSSAIAGDAQLLAQFGALSSATVRNELAELENLGLLRQPHTSAGRVPTEAGYRFYVDESLRPRAISGAEERQLEVVAPPAASFEDALREGMAVLAKLTGYPAVASLPSASRDTMRFVQLNPLAPRRLVLVLVTAAGRIEHRLFEIDAEISASRLKVVVNFLNENLGGQNLSNVRALDFETVSKGLHDAAVLELSRRVWELVRDSIKDISDEKIVVQGLITLLDEPEFAQIGTARAAMRLFEDENAIGGLLRLAQELPPEFAAARAVRIGHEMPHLDPNIEQTVTQFSFVGISYGAGGETLGALGVMGPSRMRYADAVALVPALAARLQMTLESF
jgi:heat-inducible transcriptional repressor